MFGELSDAIVLREGAAGAMYMDEIPFAFYESTSSLQVAHSFSLRLDYGHAAAGGYADHSIVTFAPGQAHGSQFLHPIIRYYRPHNSSAAAPTGAGLRNEFHIVEDFLTTWNVEEVHVKPLTDFIQRCLDGDYTTQADMLQAHVDAAVENAEGPADGRRLVVDDAYFGQITTKAKFDGAEAAAAANGGNGKQEL